MSFGLAIYQGSGQLTYSSDSVTWNQVESFEVAANGSFSQSFPVLSGREVMAVQMLIDPPPINRKAIAHTISVSGTTISVSGGSERSYILVLMR
jgi:hypothetical protein